MALDVREVASFTDTFVFASGTSDRHTKSIADAIDEAVRREGEHPLGIEGYEDGKWILMDLNDVIVHIFQREVREHYDLERLWSDADYLDVGTADPRSAAQ